LAERLEVDKRTIYRDIAELMATGVPIDGEAGVGYLMREGFDLPPLMFTRDEIVALVAGARMVRALASPELAKAAELALAKISTALPPEKRVALERTRLYALSFAPKDFGDTLDTLRHAIARREVALLDYRDGKEAASTRHVWPLGLYYWGSTWTLAAWCELRVDFRNFRLDRIASALVTGREYPDQAGRRLEDFVRAMRSRGN